LVTRSRLRQRRPDHRNRQRRAGHDAQRRPGQGINPLGTEVMLIEASDKRTNILQVPAKPALRLAHDTLIRQHFNML
jgi:predicted neutral ceramidase superfamily lipid hydrolase